MEGTFQGGFQGSHSTGKGGHKWGDFAHKVFGELLERFAVEDSNVILEVGLLCRDGFQTHCQGIGSRQRFRSHHCQSEADPHLHQRGQRPESIDGRPRRRR